MTDTILLLIGAVIMMALLTIFFVVRAYLDKRRAFEEDMSEAFGDIASGFPDILH